MSNQPLYVFGAGGHAKVVVDLVEREGLFAIAGILDDDSSLYGQMFFDCLVLGGREKLNELKMAGACFLVAIGNNDIRQQVSAEIVALGGQLISAVHPSAALSRGVELAPGCVVMGGCVINADTVVGRNVIVNTAASVDHDCIIGDSVHIAPGATLCGGVTVGAGSFIGAGVTIIPGVTVGRNVMVGAGATVVTDVLDSETVIGTPAKALIT